jgi:outer membrane protein
VSFARVSLGEAQLLQVQAQNDVASAYAELAAAMGAPDAKEVPLEDEPLPDAPPADVAPLVAGGLRDRPDVEAARFSTQAASRVVDAERSLMLPSISAVGSLGTVPYRVAALNQGYSAFGINVNVPVTNGNLFNARRAEASYRFDAETQKLHDLENQVARDVRVAWLDAQTSFRRLALTDQLLDEATQALDLAQARYDLGLSSIVELTQAQLSKTQAEIAQATARYEFQSRSAALRYQTGALRSAGQP